MSSTASTSPKSELNSGKKRGWLHLASAWIPVFICLAVIALESTAMFGADHTSGPLQRFLEYMLHRRFNPLEWWQLHYKIRKAGHFLGYGILSVACFRAVWMTFRLSQKPLRRQLACHGLAMLGTLIVASSDELHQLYLPNRTGTIVDVGIDCLGGLAMQVLLSLWVWLWVQAR